MCLGKREKMYFQANYETSWEIISQCSRLYDLAKTPSMRCAILSTLSSALPWCSFSNASKSWDDSNDHIQTNKVARHI